MTIREMTMSDYAQCRALWEASPGVRMIDADSEERISLFLSKNPGLSFVAESDGRVIGTALAGHDGRRGFLYHVAVSPEFRGQHVGTGIVDCCIDALQAEGIDKCHVFVLKDNEVGNAFWANGWTLRQDIFIYSRDF